MPQTHNVSPPNKQISILAVTIALFLVLVAILFGIYGPKIANRLTLMGGVPLSEIVDASAHLRKNAILKYQQHENETPIKGAELDAKVSQLLGRPCAIPDLTEAGYQLWQVAPASLPGAPYRSAELVYRNTLSNDARWLVLYLAADNGQYLIYNAFSSARQFMPDTFVLEDISATETDTSMILIWSDGPVLYLACVDNQHEAEMLQSFLSAQ